MAVRSTTSSPAAATAATRRQRLTWTLSVAVFALLIVTALSLMLGAVTLSAPSVLRALVEAGDGYADRVVWDIRLPRTLAAMVAGAALGVAGALLQTITRNPLADPAILGVSAAAGLVSSVVLVSVPQIGQPLLTLAAVVGGLFGAGAIFVIAWRGIVSPLRLTLAGVALSALFGAAIVGLLASSRTFLQLSLNFLAGGLYGADWSELTSALPWFLVATALAIVVAGRLNVLALGDEIAAGLGLAPTSTRLGVLTLAGILTGAAVSISGMASFVGLVSPHLARFAVGHDARRLLPTAALVGALLVASADLIARLIIRPAEIPMGIITAALGAPFLLYLLRVHR